MSVAIEVNRSGGVHLYLCVSEGMQQIWVYLCTLISFLLKKCFQITFFVLIFFFHFHSDIHFATFPKKSPFGNSQSYAFRRAKRHNMQYFEVCVDG